MHGIGKSRVPNNFPYRGFLIIRRAIVIEGNKFPIGIPGTGKQNFPGTGKILFPCTRDLIIKNPL